MTRTKADELERQLDEKIEQIRKLEQELEEIEDSQEKN